MKKKLIYISVLALATIFSSCKKDEIFATKAQSAGTILFQVDDKALTGTVFVGAIQPSLDVSAARFSKAATASPNYFGGNAVVTVNLTSELNHVVINLVNTTTGAREKKADINGVSGSTVWTAPLTTLGFANANPTAGSTLTFEFIASNADGTKTTTRVFQVQVIA